METPPSLTALPPTVAYGCAATWSSADVPEKITAAYYVMRAEEARSHADEMRDPVARRMMFDIAEGYDRLSEWLAKLEEDGG